MSRLIKVTKAAQEKLAEILKEQGNGAGIRVYIAGVG